MMYLTILFKTFGFFALENLFFFLNLLTLNVPDKGYSKNVSFVLNYISTVFNYMYRNVVVICISFTPIIYLKTIYLKIIYLKTIYLKTIYLKIIYLKTIYLKTIYLKIIYLKTIYFRRSQYLH
jgi:hypothetical protein